jgi:hypothetical protein
MLAFHSLWTKPYLKRTGRESFSMSDFEMLTMILSALKWRQYNGPIKMITDDIGFYYLQTLGLLDLWDVMDGTTLNQIDDSIDPQTFWAAGKLFALRSMEQPCVMLDTDFIAWSQLNSEIKETHCAVIHNESLHEAYPDWHTFQIDSTFYIDPSWDKKTLPVNTAFAWFGVDEFRKLYTEMAIQFMRAAVQPNNPITYMVFAEQRLLAVLAQQCGIDLHIMDTLKNLFDSKQRMFTHLWGHKEKLRQNRALRRAFVKRISNRIVNDFPSESERLQRLLSFFN